VEIRDLLLCKRTVSSSFLSQSPPRQVTDVYIVTELMQSDLGRVLDHHNSTLTTEQVRAIMFQFVLGLAHLHENGIIHRDIKPGNLLVDKMWRLKICDLGIARESSRY
jgi:serine/threonine protein kinase